VGIDIKAELSKLALANLVDIPQSSGKPPGVPDITKAKALAVLNKLREIAKHNGYRGIAKAEKIPEKWVRKLDLLRKEVIAEKQPKEIEDLE